MLDCSIASLTMKLAGKCLPAARDAPQRAESLRCEKRAGPDSVGQANGAQPYVLFYALGDPEAPGGS